MARRSGRLAFPPGAGRPFRLSGAGTLDDTVGVHEFRYRDLDVGLQSPPVSPVAPAAGDARRTRRVVGCAFLSTERDDVTAFPSRPDLYQAPRPSQARPRRADPWPDGDKPEAREWALLFVSTGRESAAAEDLEALGYHGFLPMLTVWRDLPRRLRAKLGKRREPVTGPAFPSYVFVGFDPDRLPPTPLYQVRHALTVIRADPAAQARLAADLDRLRAAEASGDVDLVKAEAEALRERMAAIVGKPVAILEGPLAGLEGVAEGVRGRDRLEVSVHGARVVIPHDALREVEP
ncbi:MAG: transcription termination/antitermination protein NusG [Salinarimonas sp.]